MTDKARLVKNFLSLLSLRGLEFLIPLLTLPYLLRTIGVENYGLVGFSYSFALFFGAIVQFGFGVTATRDIARNRHNLIAIGQLYSNILTCSGLLALGALVISMLLVLIFSNLRDLWQLHLLSLSQVLIQSIFPVWFFQGMERMAYIAYLNLASKSILVIGLLFFVHAPDDYICVPLINIISVSLVLCSSIWIVKRDFNISLQKPKWEEVKKSFICGRHAFVNQFAPNLYNNSTTFLLGLFSGGYALGLFSAATKIVDAVSSIGYIASNTFLPYLSRSIKNHEIFKRIMLAGGLVGSLSAFLSSELIGQLLHPTDGPAIAELIRMDCASVFMIFTMLTFGTNFLMLKKKEETAGRISLYTSLTFFLIALVTVPYYGAMGGMVTLVGARTTMAALLYLNYRKIILRPV